MINENLTIIAGPCSVDSENREQVLEIAQMSGIHGVRVVPLKSRTALDETGKGMGIDFNVYIENQKRILNSEPLIAPPSIEIVRQIFNETGIMVATEIMDPHLQMPHYKNVVPARKLLAWQPSVDQLGWHVHGIKLYAEQNEWIVGLKNGKWTGTNIDEAKSGNNTIESAWSGLSTFAGTNAVLIHRGFDIPEKGSHRNMPIHEIAARVKKNTGLKMLFDPSHSYGPKLREQIVTETIGAMKIRMTDSESFLYDGILIEAGDSKTDTHQHIKISELKQLTEEVGRFRTLTEL